MLFLSCHCRLAVSLLGLLSATGLQADVLPRNWGPETPGSCTFWCRGPALLPKVIWEGLSLLSFWQQLLEQPGCGYQSSPLPWFS